MSTCSSTTRAHRSLRWLIGPVAIAIALVAILAPSAQATRRPYTPWAPQNAGLPSGQAAIPDNLEPYTPWAPQNVGLPSGQAAIPDGLKGGQLGPAELPVGRFVIPKEPSISGRGFGPASFATPSPAVSQAADDFDLGDAGIGAALAIVVALVLAGLAASRRRRHGRLAGA